MSVRFDLILKKWKITTKPMIQITEEQNDSSASETATHSFDFHLKEEFLQTNLTFKTLPYVTRTRADVDISVENKTVRNYLAVLLNVSNIQLILCLILFFTLLIVINLSIAHMMKRCLDCFKKINCKKISCWVYFFLIL